jgi:hypothetical protein
MPYHMMGRVWFQLLTDRHKLGMLPCLQVVAQLVVVPVVPAQLVVAPVVPPFLRLPLAVVLMASPVVPRVVPRVVCLPLAVVLVASPVVPLALVLVLLRRKPGK